MSVVEASIVLPASPQRVWDVVMDPHRLGEWVTIHRELLAADPGPPRVGLTMRQRLHLRGVNVEIDWELGECEDARFAVWEGHGPAHSRARTEYSLSPADDRATRFDYRNEFKPPFGPLGAVVSRALIGGMAESEAHRSLEHLREILGDGHT